MASASFTASVDNLTVTFNNTGTGNRFLWDFGNGQVSNAFSPIYTYKIGGIYSVALTAVDSSGYSTVTNSVTATRPGDLTDPWFMPFTLPMTMNGRGDSFTTNDIEYKGSWHTYPKITLTGPYSGVTIANTGTGAKFSLVVGIPSGAKRIIAYDIDNLAWSIKDENGMDKFYESSPDSNFVNFNIQPTNLIKGRQIIAVRFTGISSATKAVVEYYVAEFGQ